MKSFSFYEFSGYLLPGVVLLVGLSLQIPNLATLFQGKDFNIGDLGLFVVLSYTTGHLVQALGATCIDQLRSEKLPFESLRRKAMSLPTDALSNSNGIFSSDQRKQLFQKIQERFKLPTPLPENMDLKTWQNYNRQIITEVSKLPTNSSGGKLEVFNAYTGMFRGLGTSFILLFIVEIMYRFYKPSFWTFDLKTFVLLTLPLFLAIISFMRMKRFSKYYAQELIFSFLAIPSPETTVPTPSNNTPLVLPPGSLIQLPILSQQTTVQISPLPQASPTTSNSLSSQAGIISQPEMNPSATQSP